MNEEEWIPVYVFCKNKTWPSKDQIYRLKKYYGDTVLKDAFRKLGSRLLINPRIFYEIIEARGFENES